MLFPLLNGVKIPKKMRAFPSARRKYNFEDMEVGQMFFVPNKTKNSLATHTSAMGKRLKRKFITRLIAMQETDDGWVLADANSEDAVRGIGVWRIE